MSNFLKIGLRGLQVMTDEILANELAPYGGWCVDYQRIMIAPRFDVHDVTQIDQKKLTFYQDTYYGSAWPTTKTRHHRRAGSGRILGVREARERGASRNPGLLTARTLCEEFASVGSERGETR